MSARDKIFKDLVRDKEVRNVALGVWDEIDFVEKVELFEEALREKGYPDVTPLRDMKEFLDLLFIHSIAVSMVSFEGIFKKTQKNKNVIAYFKEKFIK